MHTPVFGKTIIELCKPEKGKRYVDATFGEGGHTKLLLATGASVLAIDRDSSQIEKQNDLCRQEQCLCIVGNFANLEELAKLHGFTLVDGVLFDLGLSYKQIKEGKKGLSFKNADEKLDMRLDATCPFSASDILAHWSKDHLESLFIRNSEEIHAAAIASCIIQRRKKTKNLTVRWLVDCIKNTVRMNQSQTVARIFQALRIEVNNEFENLKKGLTASLQIVKKGGILMVISFHSLEDRMVKLFMNKIGVKQYSKNAHEILDTKSFERSAVLRYCYL